MTSLSLIVPIYNGGDFIDNLTGHIVRLHQAVAGIEFILVNDGSTDTTSRQLHAFFNNHAHLNLNYQLLEQENGGVSSARNLALQVAGGEYVMFMDHDDNIDVDKLAPLLKKCALAAPISFSLTARIITTVMTTCLIAINISSISRFSHLCGAIFTSWILFAKTGCNLLWA